MRSFTRTLVTVAIALALAGAAAAQTTPYELSPTTKLVWGCLGPCACPVIWTGAVEGGFALVHLGDSQRFSYFTVRDVAWSYRVPGTERVAHVTGDGVYQFGFGAEDSVVQRMQLELVTDGSLAQHFDSGFVPFHWENPKIDIDLHVDVSRCADSLLHLIATPSSASTGTRPPVIRIATAPNPTRAD